MFKRLFMIIVLCIGLMGLSVTDAKAWPLPSLPPGWPIVSNTDLTIVQLVYKVRCDTYEGEEVCVILDFYMAPTEVSFSWCNPAGWCDPQRGVPFHMQGPIAAQEVLQPADVDEKAKYIEVTKSFTPAELYEIVKYWLPTWDHPDYGAPNKHWKIDPDSIVFEQLHLRVDAKAVSRDNTFLELADYAQGCFTRPEGGGIYTVIWDVESCPTE